MFQIAVETQIKLYVSNNFLVIITAIVLMSDNIGNIPFIKGFQNPHLAFIFNKYTNVITIRIEAGAFWLHFFPKLELELFRSNFHQLGPSGSVFDRFWQFLTVFFSSTVTYCDKLFFLKLSDSVWQTFFFKHSEVLFCGKFILRKN